MAVLHTPAVRWSLEIGWTCFSICCYGEPLTHDNSSGVMVVADGSKTCCLWWWTVDIPALIFT